MKDMTTEQIAQMAEQRAAACMDIAYRAIKEVHTPGTGGSVEAIQTLTAYGMAAEQAAALWSIAAALHWRNAKDV